MHVGPKTFPAVLGCYPSMFQAHDGKTAPPKHHLLLMAKPDFPSLLAEKFTYEFPDDGEQTYWEQHAQKQLSTTGSMY